MASIFRKDDKFYDKPNRNNFDLSFQNNFTLNAGNLVPVFCKEVLPGDSFRIDPTFGIRAMPLVWPIQTRMKTYLHFYYVRNRNLWKDWPDFIGGTKQNLVPPYIYLTEENRDMVNTGEIGDYFGIPTVSYGEFGNVITSNASYLYYDFNKGVLVQSQYAYAAGFPVAGSSIFDSDLYTPTPVDVQPTDNLRMSIRVPRKNTGDFSQDRVLKFTFNQRENPRVPDASIPEINIYAYDNNGNYIQGGSTVLNVGIGEEITVVNDRFALATGFIFVLNTINYAAANDMNFDNFRNSTSLTFRQSVEYNRSLENRDVLLSDLPFISDSNPDGLRLSALPFRAYESVYNCIYRNAENNPLIGSDGQPEYNKWILNNDGGADTTHYKLHQRNWEDDFLTTALPSPQQGHAPLVGLSGTATITMASDDGTETITATTDESGNITSLSSGNDNLSDALSSMVDYGISINDFRNVNALQRWLENNIRRGYKYQDQIQTHYGVSVRYDELDMPEFIGGSSQSFVVNQISQTVSSDDQVLGDYAGQTSCVGSGNAITHYCDEHGYIIGILCISPVPNYSQLLPKHFLKTDKFDFFFPEFGHIGPQPIPLKEITPLQTYRQQKEDASVTLDDTFGYQRAWYEYLASTDEVHGLFRNQLRNFVMNRTFDSTPELGAEFTTIDPEQLNDVFAVQDTNHKFLGQVYFDVSAKRPIPLYGIPKLE